MKTIRKRRVMDANDYRQFERLHKDGAQKFGLLWLTANEDAIEMLREVDLDPEVEKLLGSMIAYRLCEWSGAGGWE